MNLLARWRRNQYGEDRPSDLAAGGPRTAALVARHSSGRGARAIVIRRPAAQRSAWRRSAPNDGRALAPGRFRRSVAPEAANRRRRSVGEVLPRRLAVPAAGSERAAPVNEPRRSTSSTGRAGLDLPLAPRASAPTARRLPDPSAAARTRRGAASRWRPTIDGRRASVTGLPRTAPRSCVALPR